MTLLVCRRWLCRWIRSILEMHRLDSVEADVDMFSNYFQLENISRNSFSDVIRTFIRMLQRLSHAFDTYKNISASWKISMYEILAFVMSWCWSRAYFCHAFSEFLNKQLRIGKHVLVGGKFLWYPKYSSECMNVAPISSLMLVRSPNGTVGRTSTLYGRWQLSIMPKDMLLSKPFCNWNMRDSNCGP